jgi:hypothetical protein
MPSLLSLVRMRAITVTSSGAVAGARYDLEGAWSLWVEAGGDRTATAVAVKELLPVPGSSGSSPPCATGCGPRPFGSRLTSSLLAAIPRSRGGGAFHPARKCAPRSLQGMFMTEPEALNDYR